MPIAIFLYDVGGAMKSVNPNPTDMQYPLLPYGWKVPATERFVPNVSAGGASPLRHRRTDT